MAQAQMTSIGLDALPPPQMAGKAEQVGQTKAGLDTATTFALGLILVIVAGAELFTGNNLIVMAWASRRVTTLRVARNWTIVYVGNFVGAVATAGIVYAGKQYEFAHGAVGEQALTIAAAKTNLGFVQAIALGALCNALVCLAVWLCYSARTTADKVLSIIPPIAAFVAVGFEPHARFERSGANMYFIPYALCVKGNETKLSFPFTKRA